jgi:transposase
MNATTVEAAGAMVVGVDVAKNIFQLAVANGTWKITETHRLSRHQFERWFANRSVDLVILEACGSAHHWARWLRGLGIEVKLLRAAYIRAYVKRNKTDAADAAALLEAARASDIVPVRVKSVEQRALHRTRSLWMQTRTSRINALRGFCGEFGIAIAQGSRVGVEQISRVLADPNSTVPSLIRSTMKLLIEEIRLLEARIAQLERELTQVARYSPACTTLLSIPGWVCGRLGHIALDEPVFGQPAIDVRVIGGSFGNPALTKRAFKGEADPQQECAGGQVNRIDLCFDTTNAKAIEGA